LYNFSLCIDLRDGGRISIDPNWVIAGLLAIQTIYIGATFHRKEGKPVEGRTSHFQRPTLVVAVLMLLTWASVGYDYYDRHYRSSAPTPVVEAYGVTPGPGGGFMATVNGAEMQEYHSDYKAILIVRVAYANVDEMTDPRIEKSTEYTITNGPMLMAVVPHPEFKLNLSSTHDNVIVYYAAVLPRGISEGQIVSLSDVTRLGGKILGAGAQKVGGLKLEPTFPQPPAKIVTSPPGAPLQAPAQPSTPERK
jgi:hypothetical protein